jgi:hypothetical protein
LGCCFVDEIRDRKRKMSSKGIRLIFDKKRKKRDVSTERNEKLQ